MAIAVYGFTVVVPLSSIERGYLGGLLAWIEERREYVGTRIWFDDRLAATTYYDPAQSFAAVREWAMRGFATGLCGKPLDAALLCAQVDQQLGLLNKDVDWLEFDGVTPSVWVKGLPPGRIAGPEKILATLKQ